MLGQTGAELGQAQLTLGLTHTVHLFSIDKTLSLSNSIYTFLGWVDLFCPVPPKNHQTDYPPCYLLAIYYKFQAASLFSRGCVGGGGNNQT